MADISAQVRAETGGGKSPPASLVTMAARRLRWLMERKVRGAGSLVAARNRVMTTSQARIAAARTRLGNTQYVTRRLLEHGRER